MFLAGTTTNDAPSYHTLITMERTAGINSDPNDRTDNIEIFQSGGTNYQSMVADIGGTGPVDVQYIHWSFSNGVNVEEVMCYENKRVYASEVINPKAKSQLKEKKLKQKERKGKQYDYDDYEEFGDDDGDYEDDAEVVDVVDTKDGSSGAQEEGDDTEDCETKEAKSKVRVCVPKFSSVEQTVNLYTSHPSDVRHCYDV